MEGRLRQVVRTEESHQEYKGSQNKAKREVAKLKQKPYNGLYERRNSKEGEKDLDHIARRSY